MDVQKAIMGRRSVREYLDKPVPKGVIDKILKAGAMAPSAMDAQPCRYIVITDRNVIKNLSDRVKSKLGALGFGMRFAERARLKEDTIFYNAPLLVLIVASEGRWRATDCSLAAQNMMLRAYDLGIGSCFIGLAQALNNDGKTLKELGIGSSQRLFCPLIFGYPKSWPKPKERKAKIQKSIE